MNIVIVGHVDHGKSTLMGRLLADTDSLPEGKLEQVKETCRRNAKPFEYAFLLDALKDEQAQGITIDTARCFFKTEKRDYIILDAPGHIEFLKNMITGASRAEAALLMIDAKEGVQENSRRHAYMLSMLGIHQIAVVINKMDLVDYSQDVYEKVKKELLYNIETVSEQATTYFFSLAMAQVEYDMAKENVATTDTLYRTGQERHKIAAISQADLLTLKLDAINARNTLQNADIALKRAMFSLASYLNFDKNTEIRLRLPSRPHDMDIPVDQALTLARENNPKFLEVRQEVLEAEQQVDKTKKETLFNASLNASIGFNQVATQFKEVYKNPLQQDLVSISISIPLIDWGVRKGKYNIAKSNLNVTQISARQTEVTLEEDVIMTVGDFNVQQNLIASAEEALDIAIMAYNETKQRFMIGKADINSLTLSLNRQQEAQRNYITALQNYWLSYYKIRKLTLHDFETGISLANEFDYEHGF